MGSRTYRNQVFRNVQAISEAGGIGCWKPLLQDGRSYRCCIEQDILPPASFHFADDGPRELIPWSQFAKGVIVRHKALFPDIP